MDVSPREGPKRFVHQVRVGWADCDPAKIAYTGRLPCFALEAIDAWWEHHVGADWYRLNLDRKIGTPFVHLDLDFRSPVTPRFRLGCEVVLKDLGRSSITFFVRGSQNDRLCFEGTFVSVFVDPHSFEKIPVPAEIERLVTPLLGGGSGRTSTGWRGPQNT